MNIRAKLTLTFFSIVIIVLTVISVSIYFFSENYREQDFYRRLKNRAINTARVLMEVKEVNADLLRRMERNNPASLPNQYIVIYDHKNELLYSSEGSAMIPVDTTLLREIRQKKELRYAYKNYEVVGFVFAERSDRHTIIAAASDVYGLDALQNLRNILIITFLVSMVLVSILGWVYAGKVLQPISKIVTEVANISGANLSQRLDEGNKRDELSKLATTFNSMLDRLQSAFRSQRNFIANASHEIKTPITVMTGEIEVALLQDRDQAYYIQSLRSVLTGLRGLNKLSTQLLLLAQTTAEHPEKKFTAIRIDDALWDAKEHLVRANSEYTVDILFDLNLRDELLRIEGDEQLVKVAITNLMDNGCKYSTDNHVTINLKTDGLDYIAIEFSNQGPGIDPEDIGRIFDPFVRGGSDKKVRGFGIGLSLVKAIMQLHNGQIKVDSERFGRTCFTLLFPLNNQAV